jgi:AraC-like DNA-binding protein
MTLTYFDNSKISNLIEEIFELTFSIDDIPFQTTILPLEYTNLTYITGNQKALYKQIETPLEGLIISGQFFGAYQFLVNSKSRSFGLSFHPTALYKLLNTKITLLENKHLPLKKFHPEFFNQMSPILDNYKSSKDVVKKLNLFFANAALTTNNETDNIDKVIDLIRKKDGLLSINDILEDILISQKSLELQFKKIVGLTPGKYIRKFRFLKLMRRFEIQEIDLKDLIYMYNYYDQSHFAKDFKLFMMESPTSYFKKEYPLIKEYLKN